MQLLHTTAGQLQLQRLSNTHRCEATHSKICPSLYITLAWLKWTRLFLLCYGWLCCCCCYSDRCRCFPSGCLAATDFQTAVWFGFYTLAEKPESDVYCSTCRTRLRVCVLLATHIYRFLVFRCFHFKSIFQLLKQVFRM